MIDELAHTLMATPEGRANPYELYEQMRSIGPALRSEELPVWYLTGFDDCRALLRDNRCGKGNRDDDGGIVPGASSTRTKDDRQSSMLFMDPPDHTRIRGLVSRAFTPRRVEKLREEIASMVDELLDEAGGEGDLIELLGYPLPVRVIGELVGVPREDRDQFRPLTAAMVKTLEPLVSEDEARAAESAAAEATDYFTTLIAERRADPQDDLLSGLIGATDGRDALSEDEMIATIILIYAAGFETTTNLIGNGTYTLLSHPDQLSILRGDPTLVPNALEEMLRYESPVQLDGRQAYEDIDIGGEQIPAGETVLTLLGAANRDPDAFEDPARFDVRRSDIQILSFGSGIHYCLGASLARLEGQVVFERLLDRFATIELCEEPTWRGSLTLRGLDALNVRLG